MRYLFGLFWVVMLAQASTAMAEDSYATLEHKIFAPFTQNGQLQFQEGALSILSSKDRQLYHRAFALQESAEWRGADKLIAQIDDRLLLGYLRFQRLMHPTGYRSKFHELADWLDNYAQLSGANRIYRLAKKRRPNGNGRGLVKPQKPSVIVAHSALGNGTKAKKKSNTVTSTGLASKIKWQIKGFVQEGRITYALNRLKKSDWRKALNDQQYVQALGDIAKGYVIHHVDAKAIKVADEALKVDPNYPGQAFWWAGLAAWRQKDYDTAAEFFTLIGNNLNADPELAAAANFWTWRVAMRQGSVTSAHQALIQASKDGHSFYGQLARNALNIPDEFDWNLGANTAEAKKLILTSAALQRILALAEVGQHGLAQQEFDRLSYKKSASLVQILMLVADRAGLANTVLSLGRQQRSLGLEPSDISKHPLPKWPFLEHYTIDRAFLYGLILKESAFRMEANSSAGAQGLMQIIPSTARMMQKRLDIQSDGRFYEPSLNLTLGQEYLRFLMTLPEINYNLIYTLVGYNAGPSRLREWRNKLQSEDDALLFIETIPVRETRLYVEYVLNNLWIYRKRLGQDTPSLERILEGKWPLYQRMDVAG